MQTTQGTPTKSPKDLGYSFPDEWEEHAGTMMIFPTKLSYGKKTAGLRKEFAEIARAIAKNEPVHIYCIPGDHKLCQELFGQNINITLHKGDYTIDWARDNAPILLKGPDGKLASAGFRNNGWGKKYRGWKHDADTRDNISKAMNWPIFHSDLVLEGGAIKMSNNVGVVTESCVLNKNRPTWKKEKVEAELKRMLGLDKIIWIKSGLMPDPITDGHVDGLLKWIAKDTVILHTTDLKSDPNYQICQDAKKTLLAHGLKVIELPLAEDMVHMNFYIGNKSKGKKTNTAYVPICGDPKQDEPALEIIRQHFDHVIPIKATLLAEEGGGIHCYTQQIPK